MKTLSLKKIGLLVFLVGTVLTIQLAAIERPYFGHFSSYQIVSASMARNMLIENFSQPLQPKTDFTIGKKKSMPLNQYPFHSLFAALPASICGGTLEFWGRFQAVVFNLLSIALIGLIAAIVFNPLVGWITFICSSLSPFTLIYGQMFMSESSALFFMLLSIYLLLARRRQAPVGWLRAFAAGIPFSIAVAGRIHLVLFLPLLCLYVFFSAATGRRKQIIPVFGLLASALALPLAWYVHTYFLSIASDNVHTNLFLQLSSRRLGDQQYLLDVDYYRLVLDIFTQKILTPLLFPFFIMGLALFNWRPQEGRTERLLVLGGCLFGLLIIFFFPQKIRAHEFYLYGAFPFVMMTAALAVSKVLDTCPNFKKTGFMILALMVYLAVSSRYFLHPIFKYPDKNNNVLVAARILQQKTRPDDWLIIAGKGFSELVYYAQRPSWPLHLDLVGKPLSPYSEMGRFSGNDLRQMELLDRAMKYPVDWLEYLRGQGARYLIAPYPEELEPFPQWKAYIEQHFKRIETPDNLFFYDLSAVSADKKVLKEQTV